METEKRDKVINWLLQKDEVNVEKKRSRLLNWLLEKDQLMHCTTKWDDERKLVIISGEWNDLFDQFPKLEDWINTIFKDGEGKHDVPVFDDEWTICTHCYSAVSMNTDDYVHSDDGILCKKCTGEFLDEVIEYYQNQPSRALPSWFIKHIDDWTLLQSGYKIGLHEGDNDDPRQIMRELCENRHKYLFVVDDADMFTVNFSVYTKDPDAPDNSEYEGVEWYYMLGMDLHEEPPGPLKCIHCGKIGEITIHKHIGDGLCGECGEWQLENDEVEDKADNNLKNLI